MFKAVVAWSFAGVVCGFILYGLIIRTSGDMIFTALVSMMVAWIIWLGVAPHKTQDQKDFPDDEQP